jgi:hypothetical protein
MSDLREDFLRKSLSRKIRFAEILNGRNKASPTVPYESRI